MAALSSTVAAALVVPFVLQGEPRGKLYDAKCGGPPARSALASLLEVGRRAGDAEPVIVSTGDLLAPNPKTQYPIERGGDAHDVLGRALVRPDGTPIFDVILPGNFELSLPRQRLTELAAKAPLAWTIANMTPKFPAERERIVERGGVRIGITGALDESLAPKLSPAARAENLEPAVKGLTESIQRLRAGGATVVVMLVHVGWGEGARSVVQIVKGLADAKLAPDLVLSSNLEGDVSLMRMGEHGTPVIPAPDGWDQAAVVRLRVEPGGAALEDSRTVRLTPAEDPRFDAVNQILCKDLDVALGPRAPSQPVDKRTFLTFLLELMRATTGAEIAILNTGAFGGDFPMAGPVSALAIQRAIPFENALQVAEVKGAKLAALTPLAENPRAVVLGIAKGKAAGRAIDDLRPYRVVTIDFVAEGGDDLIKPGTLSFVRREDLPTLRALASEFIRTYGLETDADPDEDLVIEDPLLLGARLQLGANVKSVRVNSDPADEYKAPQLALTPFLGANATLDVRLSADWPFHRLELVESTRFGFAKDDDKPIVENEDVTKIELAYVGRFAGPDRHWAIPDGTLAASLETEFTKPEDRTYHRALLEAGVGPVWALLTKKLLVRSRIGVRRELLADVSPADATKLALLSTLELLDFAVATVGTSPVVVGARLDHALDFTGMAKDNILQGRFKIDVPIAASFSATAGLELYVQHRDEEGRSHGIGTSVNTTFGLKTTTDLSAALY